MRNEYYLTTINGADGTATRFAVRVTNEGGNRHIRQAAWLGYFAPTQMPVNVEEAKDLLGRLGPVKANASRDFVKAFGTIPNSIRLYTERHQRRGG